ncbi:hypothetical protein AMTR_s00117p00134960 [Amborella trichopoda]|uniref:Cytochrome P450 n=1 Tax=Amborella trichopoda TaxID=13333 RepID=W1NR52_AMBTC|nr:hypothetical protein AMTR_s00117p00134960 [Amborella trichopoda]
MEGVLLLCFALLVLWVTLKIGYAVWWRPRALEKHLEKQGIRGPPYKILFGDVKESNRLTQEAYSKPIDLSHQIVPRVIPFFAQTVKNYGKICVTWFGMTPRVIVMEPEMVKEVLSNKFGHFEKAPSNPLTKLLLLGLVAAEGEKWARHRRILNPAFHMEKLKGMVPEFILSCKEMIARWGKLVGEEGSCEIDVFPELQELTGDVISRTAFGSSYEEGKRLFQLQREQQDLVIQAIRNIYIPGFRFLPTKKNIRRKKIDKKVRGILKGIIQRKEEAINSGTYNSHDLLGLLLESNRTNDHKNRMTMEDVVEECKLFYFAGHETTSMLLTWTMVVLSKHPTWQERARDEVLQLVGSSTPPTLDQLSHLKIVNMILHEVLRLYPPILLIVRETYKKINAGGLDFPPGIQLALPTIIIHHDRDLWGDDAKEFKPERFSDGVSNAAKHPLAFFPFGWGPRTCIGQNFALIEAKIALTMILQHFSFHLSPSYTHAPYAQITMQPQHGAPIILHKL